MASAIEAKDRAWRMPFKTNTRSRSESTRIIRQHPIRASFASSVPPGVCRAFWECLGCCRAFSVVFRVIQGVFGSGRVFWDVSRVFQGSFGSARGCGLQRDGGAPGRLAGATEPSGRVRDVRRSAAIRVPDRFALRGVWVTGQRCLLFTIGRRRQNFHST